MPQSSSSSSSSPSECNCEIRWQDDTLVTDDNRNVLPGHQINLKIFCPDDPQITNIKWLLQGKVFKSYSATESKAELKGLELSDLDDLTVQFYSADVGDSRSVSATFVADGQFCWVSVYFNVKDPTVEILASTPAIGELKFVPENDPTLIKLLDAIPLTDPGTYTLRRR